MNELLRALHLICQYFIFPDAKFPTACDHDILYVCGVKLKEIPVEYIHKLAKWGFYPGSDEDDHSDIDYENISQEKWDEIKNDLSTCFRSYRFGSC